MLNFPNPYMCMLLQKLTPMISLACSAFRAPTSAWALQIKWLSLACDIFPNEGGYIFLHLTRVILGLSSPPMTNGQKGAVTAGFYCIATPIHHAITYSLPIMPAVQVTDHTCNRITGEKVTGNSASSLQGKSKKV